MTDDMYSNTSPVEDPLRDSRRPDGGLFDLGWYLGWNVGETTATLDGSFTADDLEAIAKHMRNTKKTSGASNDEEPTGRNQDGP